MRDYSFKELTNWENINPYPEVSDAEYQSLKAVEVAYDLEIKRIAKALKSSRSVLVECEKAQLPYVLKALQKQLEQHEFKQVVVNKGTNGNVIGELVAKAAQVLLGAQGQPGWVVVLRHLDLMVSTPDGRPRPELSELSYWFSECASVVKLAFWSPLIPPLEHARAFFQEVVSLQTFGRQQLHRLISAREAAKLCQGETLSVATQARLYQYAAATPVVELRAILRELGASTMPSSPVNSDPAFNYLREKLGRESEVDAPDMQGYKHIRERLERDVVVPMRGRLEARNDAELAWYEGIIPRGVLLHGPAGTGKTGWAKWLATALHASLTLIEGPELKQKHVGETEASIRRLFADARKAAPALIVIDEIDALTPARNDQASNFEHSMVGQLLSAMAGLRRGEAVLVVGTTNNIRRIDEAFLRPGRFLLLKVDYPTEDDRFKILKGAAAALKLALDDATLLWLAKTIGEGEQGSRFSGDHLEAVLKCVLRELLSRRVDITQEALRDQQRLKQAVDEVREGIKAGMRSDGRQRQGWALD